MAHALFADRISETWDAPAQVVAPFLLEQRLTVPGFNAPIYTARHRGSGVLCWLKCPADGVMDAKSESGEQQLLARLNHPHIINIARQLAEEITLPGCCMYAWGNESPLTQGRVAALPATDAVRIARDLLSAVDYLHSLPEPLAHGGLCHGALWIAPPLSWLRLSMFEAAVPGAGLLALRNDRLAAWGLAQELLASAGQLPASLAAAAQVWQEEGRAAYAALLRELKLAYLERVTADL